jgi:hypothetical protein
MTTTTQQRPSHLDTVLALIDEALADHERSRAAFAAVPTVRFQLEENAR